MRLICILIFLLISIFSSNAQNPLDELLITERSNTGRRFVTSKFPIEHLEDGDRDNLLYFETGILFIPKIKKEKRIDTITLEIIIKEDSIIDIKTKHSFQLAKGKRILPKQADRNCISAGNGYLFQFIDLNQPLKNEKIPFGNHNKKKTQSFVTNFNKENHTREYEINMPQEFKWIQNDSFDLNKMKKLDLGVMPSTYKDEKGNIFILFNSGYYTKYREVLCSKMGHLNINELSSIQKALQERGFDISITNFMDKKTKAALIQFQKENNFPIGYFSIETFEALGLEDFIYK